MSAWRAAAHGETLAASGNRDGALRRTAPTTPQAVIMNS